MGITRIARLQREGARHGVRIDAVSHLVDGAAAGNEVGEVEQQLAIEITEGKLAVLGHAENFLLPRDQLCGRIEFKRKRTTRLIADIDIFDLDLGLAARSNDPLTQRCAA